MSYVEARTWVKFNKIMDANYLEGEEENMYSTFLGGWSTFSTFIRGYSNLSTFFGRWLSLFTFSEVGQTIPHF